MIRRDDGDDWLLIPQVEHARLAGKVAAVWGNGRFDRLPAPERLVPAIAHHDDGWRSWPQAPEIDPQSGRPRNFNEMPMSLATEIWKTSVALCHSGPHFESASPLGGLWVSKHFCQLAEYALEGRSDNSDECDYASRFCHEQRPLQEAWTKKAADDWPAEELDHLIEVGYRHVQFFDRISLWLCCEERTEPYTIDCPANHSVCFTPVEPNCVIVEPFPLSVDSLELSVPAKRIPARVYADDRELAGELTGRRVEQISWTLVPSA